MNLLNDTTKADHQCPISEASLLFRCQTVSQHMPSDMLAVPHRHGCTPR